MPSATEITDTRLAFIGSAWQAIDAALASLDEIRYDVQRGGKILFDPAGDPWQIPLGKRRRCRGRSHEWQPEWVGSSVPGATISQAFEDKSLGGFVFYGGEIFRPEFYPVSHGRALVAVD